MVPIINQFLSGGIAVGFLAIAFFFLRFWRKTRDGLFGVFAISFSLLALERVLFLIIAAGINGIPPGDEARSAVYLVRFCAFFLIILAFVLKNRRKTR